MNIVDLSAFANLTESAIKTASKFRPDQYWNRYKKRAQDVLAKTFNLKSRLFYLDLNNYFVQDKPLTHYEVIKDLSVIFNRYPDVKLTSDFNHIKKVLNVIAQAKTDDRFREVLSWIMSETEINEFDRLLSIKKDNHINTLYQQLETDYEPIIKFVDQYELKPFETVKGTFDAVKEIKDAIHGIRTRHASALHTFEAHTTLHYSPETFGYVEYQQGNLVTSKPKPDVSLGKLVFEVLKSRLYYYCRSQLA